MPSALSPPSWASGMAVTCLSHSPLAAHSSRDLWREGLGIGGALSTIAFPRRRYLRSGCGIQHRDLRHMSPSRALLRTHSVLAQLGGATRARAVGFDAGTVGACRLLGFLSAQLTGTACARNLRCMSHVLRLLRSHAAQITDIVSPLAPAAHSLPPAKALPELRDSAAPSAYAHRHCCIDLAASGSLTHPSAAVCSTAGIFRMLWRLPDPSVRLIHHPLLISPPFQARSLLPESPVSFRSTADSPIHEISNEIMAPMTMRPLVSTPLQIWGATLGLLVHCYRSEVRIGRESTSESQHRRLTSLASTGAKSSPTQAFRPPFTSTIQFDLNQTPAFVLTATIRFKSSLKRPFDLTAWFDFKFKGFIYRTFELQAPLDLTSNESMISVYLDLSPNLKSGLTLHKLIDDVVNPDSSSEPRIRIPRSIGQRGTRYVRPVEPLGGAAPLRSCDGVCSRSAGAVATKRRIVRARLGPRLPPPPFHRSRPRPSSLVSSAGSSSESAGNAACEHERTNGGPRSLPPPPSHRTAADIGPPSSQFEPGVGCKGEHRASSVPPTPSHRTAADIGPPSSQFEPGVGCKGEHRASSVPPTPSHRASLVSSAESSSESAGNAACEHERAASRPRPPRASRGTEPTSGGIRDSGLGTRDSASRLLPDVRARDRYLGGIGIWEGAGIGREEEGGDGGARAKVRGAKGVEQAGRDRVRKAQGA
ncbi:hypothetical protein B0H15DRAFT_1006326 [Mycena belliarum]|uniref:Uncharacterized protein n=1 Tax=Mycena belliarum TaxID=1033014 RepID=A0AAD6TSB5_9AGAR|nr:hypothetical protein B0H15DRAFT_1006326 [Mycena belliae]